jgi:hypothetical protein
MPIDRTAIANYARIAMNEDVILGFGGPVTTLTTPTCSIKTKVTSLGHSHDHVAWVVLFKKKSYMIMKRFKWYTFLHPENVAIRVGPGWNVKPTMCSCSFLCISITASPKVMKLIPLSDMLPVIAPL